MEGLLWRSVIIAEHPIAAEQSKIGHIDIVPVFAATVASYCLAT